MRPIGKRIAEALGIVDEIGAANYRQVYERMDGVIVENAGKYCQRAVGLGLMTVDRSVYPKQYQAVPGWREKVKPIQRIKPYIVRPAKVPYVPGKCDLQSVWGQP